MIKPVLTVKNNRPLGKGSIFYLVMLLLFSINLSFAGAQDLQPPGILDPDDSLTVIDSAANAPRIPSYDIINDWVTVHLLNEPVLPRYKSYILSGLGFRLLYPPDYHSNNISVTDTTVSGHKLFPLLVFLHGMGEKGRAEENETQLRYVGRAFLDAEKQGVFNSYALIPQSQTGYWSEYDLAKLTLIIRFMIQHNRVDPLRITVMGISSGADGAWRLAAANPGLFCSLVDLSAASPGYVKDVARLRHVTVWIVQGAWDRKPDPRLSLSVATQLNQAGCRVKYSLLPGTGHNTLVPMLKKKELFTWIQTGNLINPVQKGTQLEVSPVFDDYRWYRDGRQIMGADQPFYMALTSGSYCVQVKNNGIWSYLSPRSAIVRRRN